MAKISFRKEEPKNPLLFSTSVENMFISEYLPMAPGNYVKVYLFGLMNAELGGSVDMNVSSNVLNLPLEEIEKAWAYWEDKGAIRQVYDVEAHAYRIEFLSLLEELYGGARRTSQPVQAKTTERQASLQRKTKNSGGMPSTSNEPERPKTKEEIEEEQLARLEEMEIRSLFTSLEEARGSSLSSAEMEKIRDTIKIYEVTPDVYAYAIKHCTEMEKFDVKYINKVAVRWKEAGCEDIMQVKELLDKESKRYSQYQRIFKEMRYTRPITDADKEMMDTWFDTWEFKLKDVLEACNETAGLRSADLRYVNKVLENKMKEAGGIKVKTGYRGNSGDSYQRTSSPEMKHNVSKKVLGAYYEFIRSESELEYEDCVENAKRKIPKMGELLSQEKQLDQAIVTFDFSAEGKKRRERQKEQKQAIQEKKRNLLLQNGFPEDYLERKYRCKRCKDTGITDDGQYCTCTKKRVEEAYRWNLKRSK